MFVLEWNSQGSSSFSTFLSREKKNTNANANNQLQTIYCTYPTLVQFSNQYIVFLQTSSILQHFGHVAKFVFFINLFAWEILIHLVQLKYFIYGELHFSMKILQDFLIVCGLSSIRNDRFSQKRLPASNNHYYLSDKEFQRKFGAKDQLYEFFVLFQS